MKKLFLFLAIAILTLELYAQPQAGTFLLGGNISFTFTKKKEKENFTSIYGSHSIDLFLLPRIGYSVSNKLAVGVYGGIEYYKIISDISDYVGIEKTVIIGSYLRNYLIVKQGGIFLEESIDYSFFNNKMNGTIAHRTKDFSLGVSPGVYYYITERISLEAKIGWLGFKMHRTIDEDILPVKIIRTDNYFDVQLNPQSILFGLTVTL